LFKKIKITIINLFIMQLLILIAHSNSLADQKVEGIKSIGGGQDNPKTKIAVLEIIPHGVSSSLAKNLSQLLTSRLGQYQHFQVISGEEIKVLLGFEESKQLLGCADDISCLAEVGGALGADMLAAGTLGKMGDALVLNLILMDMQKTMVQNRVSVSWRGREEDLIELISPYVKYLVEGERATEYQGSLEILTNRKGATVFLDDKRVGRTPLKKPLSLTIGKHIVKIRYPEYIDFQQEVIIRKDLNQVVTANLKKITLPWYKKWWVWTVAGVVATSSLATILLLKDSESSGGSTGISVTVSENPRSN